MPAGAQQLRKDALRTDRIYFSPSGPIPIPRKRAEHWVKQFNRMSAAGLAVPVPFEHQDAATPGNSTFIKSKKNFGVLTDLTIDADGQLCFSCSPRADAVGGDRKLPKFVSPQIHEKWVDPKTRTVYRDVLTHMALTDIPVNAGQSEKWQIINDPKSGQVARMSLTGTWRMADDEPDDDKPPVDTEEAAAAPDTKAPNTTDDALLRGVNTDDGTDKIFRTVLAGLADTCGMVLPEDTTAENFFERAATALIALQGAEEQEPEKVPDEYEEESNFMGTGVSAMSTAGKSQVTAPSVPTRMSAVEMAFTNDRRRQLTKRLNELVESGRATPDEIEPRIVEAGKYRLSMSDDGQLSPSMIEVWIESREALQRDAVWPADERVDRMGYESLPNPVSAEDREEERTQATTVATAPIAY